MNSQLWNKTAFAGLVFYLCLASAAFYGFVDDSLQGWNRWRVGADSSTYVSVAEQVHDADDLVPLLGFAQNLILPVIVAVSLKSTLNIALFNIVIFLFSIYLLGKTLPDFKFYVFLPFALLAPTTFSALLTLNKEIFTLLSAVLVLRWLVTGSRLLLVLLIMLSLVLRWEQAMVIALFAVIRILNWPPKRVFWMLLLGISVLFPLAHSAITLPPNLKVSSGLIEEMNKLQDRGLYFLLFVPKLVTALTSQIFRWWIPLLDRERFFDLQTGLFVIGNQLCMVGLAIFAWKKKLWRLKNRIVYFAVVYLVVFCSAPLNSPRYLYMIYIVVAGYASSSLLQSNDLRSMAPEISKKHSVVRWAQRFFLLDKYTSPNLSQEAGRV